MRLLSVAGIHHDLNISYFDGDNVHYLKLERQKQIKHFSDTALFKDNNFVKFLNYLNIPTCKIDAVCIESHLLDIHNKRRSFSNQLFFRHNNLYIVDHHYLHALSCEVLSNRPYDRSFVIDGQGGAYAWSVFKNDTRIDFAEYDRAGSIGFGMGFLGVQLGVKGKLLDHAGKVMGLQSYGEIDSEFLQSLSVYNIRNTGCRVTKTPYVSHYGMFDISHNNNKLNAARTLHEKAGSMIQDLFAQHASTDMRISYSGGVAQNVLWNTKLKNTYKNLDILPHVGDDGLSLGGIEFLRKQFNLPKFDFSRYPFMQCDERVEDPSPSTIEETALHLSQGKIVAWYQGNGEIGPRALGNRSILMDPRIDNGRDVINSVKKREYFRPFGASVLSEYAKEYFDLDYENPFMLYVGVTQKDNLKSITHVDGTCRVQTVSVAGPFRALLENFNRKTGCPVLLNTSLNVSGKPIAGHVSDAMYEFNNNNIDVLVVGNTIYKK